VRKTQNYNAAVSERHTVQTTLSLSFEFDVHVTVHRDKFLQQNQLDELISQIYSLNENHHQTLTV
jgi:hypothetical protein